MLGRVRVRAQSHSLWFGFLLDSGFLPHSPSLSGVWSSGVGGCGQECVDSLACGRQQPRELRGFQRHRCWGWAEKARPVAMERETLFG